MAGNRKSRRLPAGKSGKEGKHRVICDRRSAPRREEDRILRTDEAFLRGFFESAQDCIFVKDRALRYVRVNPAMERFMALPASAMLHKTDAQLFGRKAAKKIREHDLRALRGEMVTADEITAAPGTDLRTLHVIKIPRRDETGKIVGLYGVARDITERKRAEEALAESEVRFKGLFENMSSGVAVYEPVDGGNDFVFRAFNKAGERIDGQKRECLIGRSLLKVRPGIRKFGLFDVMRRVHRTGVAERHPVRMYKDAKLTGWYENFVYRIPSGEIVAIFDNVTERKQAEEQLRRSREDMRLLAVRLAEIDEAERKLLSRELHDRVGQTLTALGINLAHALEEMPPSAPQPALDRLKEACAQAECLADEIRGVMADLRPSVLDDYGLTAALRGYGQEVARRSGLKITVEETEEIGRLPSEVETAIFRIVQESVTNVQRHANASEICVTCEKCPDGCRVVIADNGSGFDVAAADAEKTNWGLAIMRERARAVGCDVAVHSRPGRGTTVVVEIPTAR